MNHRETNREGENPRIGEAAAWQVRLNAEGARESDFLSFEAWLADPQAQAAFDTVARISADIDEHRETIAAALRATDRAVLPLAKPARRFSFRFAGFGLAAMAAAAAAVAFLVVPQATPGWTTYETAKGATRVVHLADGSVIELNTGSSLKVSLGWFERKVAMAEGEAAFVVAHDANRPFAVDVGGRQVRDVGTDFSVLNYRGKGVVTVRSGLVDISARTGAGTQRLGPGDQLIWDGRRDLRRKADLEAAFAWQSGRLIYNAVKLADLASDLNRYFPRPIQVVGAAADYEFSGVLTLDTEDQVVQRLQAFLPIEAQEAGGQITLSAAATPAAVTAH